MSKNNVIFKGIPDGILIILDNEISFDSLKSALLERIKSAKPFFEDANISITFKGRDLTEEEELALLEIISKESGLEISFVNNSNKDDNIESLSSVNDQIKETTDIYEQLINVDAKLQNPILTAKNNITYFHKGSIRSGQKIDFAGSVVVIGDINPGGEILAEGNIIILGKVKGVVHAGCKGDTNCFISALYMTPTQLIIGDCLAYFPSATDRKIVPEYAYVKDGQIFVESLTN